jgi:hypothetical protein
MNDNIFVRIIGTLHFIYILFLSFYVWVFRKNKYDIIVLLVLATNILTWTFYNGHCLITYHLLRDKSFNINDRTLYDLLFIFHDNKSTLYMFTNIISVLYAITLYFLLKRVGFTQIVQIVTTIMYIIYVASLRLHNTLAIRIITEIVKLYFVLFIAWIIYSFCSICVVN